MKTNQTKRWGGFVLVLIISFFICILITTAYVQNKSRMEHAQMEQLVLTKSNKVNNVITKLLYKTQVLSALVIQNDGEIKDFERVAATIIDDPAIRNVILAPNGIVSNVYPLESNEKVIGLHYFSKGEGNQEAIAAKASGQLVLGGPFHLIQGGQALVGRLPVYLGEKNEENFWGLVSVTLNYPQALEGAELEQLRNQGFAYEIWRISPDTNKKQMIANSNYIYNQHASYVEKTMTILNAEWYFRLSPIRNWYQYPETWIFTFAGLLISFLLAFLVLHNYDLRKMKAEMEYLTFHDPLTGVLNRRGMLHALETLMALAQEKFVLCYIDLNQFKSINDTYGHTTGDKMLRQFATIFEQHLDEQHLFARIGGDEFILIFKHTDDEGIVKGFLDQIAATLKDAAMMSHTVNIPISFSAGLAVYPRDGETVDLLIEFADSAMYREKTICHD